MARVVAGVAAGPLPHALPLAGAATPSPAAAHEETAPTPRSPASTGERPTVPGYEILGELGRGGMGVVYQARQLSLKRIVALKMVLAGAHAGPQELARFRAEAEAVARLQHPNIVQIYAVGDKDGLPFCAFEFVEGGSLDKRINGTPLPVRDAAQLLETLARAVHHAHQHGIVHRDLKPANILVSGGVVSGGVANGERPTTHHSPLTTHQLKITDFGLAKKIDAESDQTRSGAVVGTPSYVSPEQAAGKKDIGPATDIYALGAILYEMLTGRPPFRGETVMDTLFMVLTEEPVPPVRLRPKVPRDLETICLKCLNKEPARRYPTAEALAEDLNRFLNGWPIQARPAGRLERLWRWCRHYPAAACLLAVVSVLLVVAAFGMWHLSRLSQELVQSTALESAAQESEMLDDLNTYYSSRVVDRVKSKGVTATHNYAAEQGAIPLPATLTIELGNHISEQSQRGMMVRLYSDHPFNSRPNGGPRDDFEREALKRLRSQPQEPFYRFEEFKSRPDEPSRPSLRYATARVMKQSCLDCHNRPGASTKTDWKVGDVRGVLEIIRPLDRDVARTQEGLRGTFRWIAIISATLLAGLAVLMFAAGWVFVPRKRTERRETQQPESDQ
jgi:serine/threonine protein kinase